MCVCVCVFCGGGRGYAELCMYVCMYVYMCMYVCIHVYVYMCAFVNLSLPDSNLGDLPPPDIAIPYNLSSQVMQRVHAAAHVMPKWQVEQVP